MLGIKVLEEVESSVNGKIQVVKSLGMGTYLSVGGLTQSGGIVEEIWEKTLRKVYRQLSIVNRSLILGLGGGSAAKWVRKLWPEAKIIGVEIDPMMMELGKKYLGLDKVQVQIQDALKFCKQCATKYDLVLVDLYVGDKFPKKFESKEFLELVLGLLTNSGVVVFNHLFFDRKRSEAMKFGQRLEKIFPKVEYFYPQANLLFLCYNK